MRDIPTITVILITMFTLNLNAQTNSRKVVFYSSVQSTLDNFKKNSRAQFGGNNALFNSYLTDYLSSQSRFRAVDINKTIRLRFRVNAEGTIDSLLLTRRSGFLGIDEKIEEMITSTSGKWRPASEGDNYKEEWNELWVHLYSGDLKKRTKEEYLTASQKYLEQGQLKKALKEIDNALNYDRLNIEAILVKCSILFQLDGRAEACKLLNELSVFEIEKVLKTYAQKCN